MPGGDLLDFGQVPSSFPLEPAREMSVAVEEAVLPSISTFAGLVPADERQPEMVQVRRPAARPVPRILLAWRRAAQRAEVDEETFEL